MTAAVPWGTPTSSTPGWTRRRRRSLWRPFAPPSNEGWRLTRFKRLQSLIIALPVRHVGTIKLKNICKRWTTSSNPLGVSSGPPGERARGGWRRGQTPASGTNAQRSELSLPRRRRADGGRCFQERKAARASRDAMKQLHSESQRLVRGRSRPLAAFDSRPRPTSKNGAVTRFILILTYARC